MHDAAFTLLADDEPLYLVQDVSLAHRNRLRQSALAASSITYCGAFNNTVTLVNPTKGEGAGGRGELSKASSFNYRHICHCWETPKRAERSRFKSFWSLPQMARAAFPTKAKASWNGRAMRAVFPGPDEPCNCVITRLDLFIHLSLHVSPATATQLLRNDAAVDEAAEITYLAKLPKAQIVFWQKSSLFPSDKS